MRTPRWLHAASAMVTVIALAACASTMPGGGPSPAKTPSVSPATTPPRVSFSLRITRSGGFAGVDQKISFSADGSWVYTDSRKNTTERGTLTEAQRAELTSLATSPDLAAEAAAPLPSTCNDAFTYKIEISGHITSFVDCARNAPATQALIKYITDTTPF